MAKYADIADRVKKAVEEALKEFDSVASDAESRDEDPVSFLHVKVSISGFNQKDPGPKFRAHRVEREVDPD